MRALAFGASLAVTALAISPAHHGHVHGHVAKREPAASPVTVFAPVETVVVYMLDGKPISEKDVHQGIANGTLQWVQDGSLVKSMTSIASTPSVVAAAVVESSSAPAAPPKPSTSEAHSSAPVASAPAAPASSPGNKAVDDCPKVFPSGLPCDMFPGGYGAVAVHELGLGGWTGIQNPGYSGSDGFNDINTAVRGSCSNGECCTAGSYCSYSCPPGYLKAAWPKLQGVTGQSIGGLLCSANNKLQMPDGSISKSLCVKGTDKITVQVQNKLSGNVSICRTDYPGTESETIPLTTRSGETAELACPDSSAYYVWEGKGTSAQYYLNNLNVAQDEACQWGDGSKPVGNFAPANLGVGYSSADQKGYISLAPNKPTTNAQLDYAVQLVGDDITGSCKYINGKYCSGPNFDQCDNPGCTVAVNSGTLTVVLTDH